MTYARLVSVVASVSLIAGCNLLNTSDKEQSIGRGPKAFDPYSSTASGAISLSLIQFNGCAILPDGTAVGPGTAQVPNYPAKCELPPSPLQITTLTPQKPLGVMPVLRGQTYFLNQFIAMDTLFPDPTKVDYNDRISPATWVRTMSRFKNLDWTGLSVAREEWRPEAPPAWKREVYYENAAWMSHKDATFTVDVLDASGVVRTQSVVYDRKDFLAENPYSGRTRVSWGVDFVFPPTFPGDPTMRPAPGGQATFYQNIVKIALSTSTNPFKTFTMPDVSGDGVIRVTWSEMPKDPFYFPVKFVTATDSPPTCYKLGADGVATDQPAPCTFGLTQEAQFSPPQNGKYYLPGEKFDFRVSLRDGGGHGLHPRDFLPSLTDYRNEQTNGFLYFSEFMLITMKEQSASESGYLVAGPLQNMRLSSVPLPDYFRYPQIGEPHFYIEPPGLADIIPTAPDAKTPARFTITLPPDAKPGTYALYMKGHRYFMGERLNRMDPFFFQVGQEQKTTYPNRVGNCQICHNSVISLTNVMHGLSVDNVEGCKACHNDETTGQISSLVHRIHSSSLKYPQSKRDCSVCHLTRESAATPNLVACGSCHPAVHGNQYFDLQFQWNDKTPNAYTDCGSSCHVTTPPTQHILPSN